MPKSAFVTIAGRTNAGKSSLLNALVGEKIASVSNKPQTTRTRITGIKTIGDTQLVFMDTPGLHKPKNKLSEHMLNTVTESVVDIDLLLFMMDCTRQMTPQEEAMLLDCKRRKRPVIVILNKIDLLEDKTRLAGMMVGIQNKFDPASIIPISVTEQDGVDLVEQEVLSHAKESPHFFPDEMFTDQPEKVIAAEMVREQLLRMLDDEVPHGIAVMTESMTEREDQDILDISVVIYCERESHKGIVIGKNGAMLKRVASAARTSLEDFFRIKVNLQCWVKVKEDWRNREGLIRSFGLTED
mgnify:FL=1